MNHVPHRRSAARSLAPSRRAEELQAILHAGWLDLRDLDLLDQAEAVRFHESLAGQRRQLAVVQLAALATVRGWTGQAAEPMGSSRIGTALDSSDIDLYAPVPGGLLNLQELQDLLRGRAVYEKTRTGPTGHGRHLFTFRQGTTKVDLTFVPPGDYELARSVIHEIADAFTESDRIAHTWIKHLAYRHCSRDQYDRWKEDARLRCSPTLRLLRGDRAGRTALAQGSART